MDKVTCKVHYIENAFHSMVAIDQRITAQTISWHCPDGRNDIQKTLKLYIIIIMCSYTTKETC